jgi:hypothetical protein
MVGRLLIPLFVLDSSTRHSYIYMRGARHCSHRVLVRDVSTSAFAPCSLCSSPLGHGFLTGKWKSYKDLERTWSRGVRIIQQDANGTQRTTCCASSVGSKKT